MNAQTLNGYQSFFAFFKIGNLLSMTITMISQRLLPHGCIQSACHLTCVSLARTSGCWTMASLGCIADDQTATNETVESSVNCHQYGSKHYNLGARRRSFHFCYRYRFNLFQELRSFRVSRHAFPKSG